MSAQPYEFYLGKLVNDTDVPTEPTGASGYFSAPSTSLDPRLFDGTKMLPDVRRWVLDTLYDFWAKRYNQPHAWSTVWAAGSGISYQWDADRGNGDLDILIGVDFSRFFQCNPRFLGVSEDEMATIFNLQLHDELWPITANWNGFEVTFYVNPGATDIRAIHPYAAYNISHDTWTVHPPKLPQEPRTLYPQIYWDAADSDKKQVSELLSHYEHLRDQLARESPGSPRWTNAISSQRVLLEQASHLFDAIHLGRRNAFGPGGSGYGDFYNFRWQAAKASGVVDTLRTLRGIRDEARNKAQTSLYGGKLEGADTLLTRAALWNAGGVHG
jgi:hypothetical protein